MVSAVTGAYALAVAGFVVGVGLWARLMTLDDDVVERGKFAALLVIPGFAGLSYLAMTFDVGTLTVGSETIVLPRYIDWLVTTPMLVGYVGYVAGAPRRWIVGVAAADALMIVTGGVATALAPPGKWVFFAVSALFHVSLFAVLYGVFPKYAADRRRRWGLFNLLQNHVGLLWIAYPFVWVLGGSGLGYVSAVGVSLIVAYLDVVAKVPYVYFVWNRRHSFASDAADADATEPAATGDVNVAVGD
jgi:sensory rhodopsin